ncbi:MAG: S41 family peptidase [Bacteroidota bacterium]
MKKITYLFAVCTLFFINSSFSQNNEKIAFFSVDMTGQETKGIVGIRGNVAPLSWEKTYPMTDADGDGVYEATVVFGSEAKKFEYKFVVDNGKKIQWEWLNNRIEVLENDNQFVRAWNTQKTVDVSTLKPLTPEQLAEDFSTLKMVITKVHPGLYRYNTKEEVEANFQELADYFSEQRTHGEAYAAVSKLLASIQCEHTFASYYNQKAILKAVIHRQRDKLPFTFRWIGGKMIIVENASESEALRRGTEVVAINGTSTGKILSTMLPYISADGASDNNRLRKAAIRGYEAIYDDFDVFFSLLFPVDSNAIRLEVRAFKSNEVQTITVPAMTRKERVKALNERFPNRPQTADDAWQFKVLDDEVGYLQIGTFATDEFTTDWKQFLDESFAQLKKEKIPNLIVDLRENTGGMDEGGQYLMKFLAKEKCRADVVEGRIRFAQFPQEVRPLVSTWANWIFDINHTEAPTEEGYYLELDEFDGINLKPKKSTAYNGKIYFLVSGLNVSAAYYLAGTVRTCNLGTLVGEETGGNQRGINGGTLLFLTLPNSTIEIDVPVLGSFIKGNQANSGIQPDVHFEDTQADIYNGVDGVLQQTLALIKKENN